MTKKTGGGSATNSGIDFQQRVAACFQVFLYTQITISYFLHEDFPLTVKSLHFETADAIDDLKLLCDKDHTLYLQVKRSITFSDAPDSEFIKTLDQFITQHAQGGKNTYYLLVTSSDASRRVTGELNKILTNIRLNDATFKLNPLNKTEQEVFDKFHAAFIARTMELTGRTPREQEFIEFAKRVYVNIMDVEAGMSLEKSAILLLVGKMQNPELVWALLFKNSLKYAATRASINNEAIIKILGNYQVREPVIDKAILKDAVTMNGEYSCNKEVLVMESAEGDKNEILEVPRFSGTCAKELSFANNQVRFGNDPEAFNLIYRGSTSIGLSRFIEQNPQALGAKPLVIFNSPGIEKAGQEDCIRLYSEFLDQLSDENQNISNCLHCGKPVGSKENLLIEIDDEDTPAAVGACHLSCRRPMDRVLGTARIEHDNLSPFLDEFDLKEWVTLSMKGGIMASGITPGLQGVAAIAWSGFPKQSNGDFCVKFEMEDGTKRFGFHRGKIERSSKDEANRHAEGFKLRMEKQKALNDPLGFTTINKSYGIYSNLIKGMEPDDEFVEIIGVKVVRYSQQEAKMHESGRMFYAPLCYVADKNDGSLMHIGNLVPVISEPRKIDVLAKSWQHAGIATNGLTLQTLRSDYEVDRFLAQLFGDNMHPVLDPVLDRQKQLISGNPFRPIEDYARQNAGEEDDDKGSGDSLHVVADPFWKKDELVEAEFPDESGEDKRLYGRLVYDEAETGAGLRVVIFQPVENGEPVADVQLVIPTMYISRWNGRDTV